MTNLHNDAPERQLPFDFEVPGNMGREDFMVSACNEEAFKMLDSWPDWPGSGLYIYGPRGCGKTHMAHLFADKVKRLTAGRTGVAVVSASQVNSRNVKRLAEENRCIAVDDVRPRHNDEALFHLYNMFNEKGRYMLWTAEEAPNRMRFQLPDLQSRLNSLPRIAVQEPDETMLQMLVAKLFNDRQIIIGQDVLTYIVNNAQRSFAYVRDLVHEIDEVSLAYQSAVNYAVVRKAMENLAKRQDSEPDLFEEY